MPARSREEVDWLTVDKMIAMNPDMRAFVESILVDLSAAKIHDSESDPVREVDSITAKFS